MDNARTGSVDVFRGITVVFMILVNNPGSWSHIYAPLRHAAWNGLLPADLVFPFFLFIMGVSIGLSMRARLARSQEKSAIALHILRRSAILFVLGLFLNGFPFWPAERVLEIRIPGVLQRIAVVYCITAFLYLYASVRAQAAVLGLLLFGYRALCALVPVPGIGRPALDPGQNIAAWVDRLLLDGHLWKVTQTWDPEGILSTVSAAGTCILGVWAGRIMIAAGEGHAGTLRLAAGGLVLSALGLAWHPFFPINKSLWTGSYVLCTAGIAAVCLALLHEIIDIRRISRWAGPFLAMGLNALAAFFLSSLVARVMNVARMPGGDGTVSLQFYLYEHFLTPFLYPYSASLAWAVMNAAVWLAIMGFLYQKKMFIRL